MVEVSINNFFLEISHDPLKSDAMRQKLIECVLTENSEKYLGKAYTKEQVNKLSAEEVDTAITK